MVSERELVMGLYVGFGLFVSSALHTYYAADFYERKRFGHALLDRPDVQLPRRTGYAGAVLVGIVGTLLTVGYQAVVLPPLDRLTLRLLVQGQFVPYSAFAVLLVSLAQVLGGASHSKMFLDGTLLVMNFVGLLSFVHPMTLWNTISILLLGAGGLLAGAWRIWSREFVEPRLDDRDDRAAANGHLIFPHFPSYAYFVATSLYVVVGLLAILIRYWNFRT